MHFNLLSDFAYYFLSICLKTIFLENYNALVYGIDLSHRPEPKRAQNSRLQYQILSMYILPYSNR